MSKAVPELNTVERAFLNAGALIGVNTVGASLRDTNWNLRSSPPAPHVEVAPAVAPAAKLSVAIPTMNRWHYLKDSLPKYIDNPHIDEIVICDENGFDALQIRQHYSNCKKLKIFINSTPLGAGANKVLAVSKATNDWVALLDSDNFADIDYFTTWRKYIEEHGLDKSMVYAPSICHTKEGHADFDYSKHAGKAVTKETLKERCRDGVWEMILNTGNFIINKQNYLLAVPTHPAVQDLLTRNSCLEALLKAGALVAHGMKYFVVPDMKWYHGINRESVYAQNNSRFDADHSAVFAYFATIT
jgi:glycosyltransferase involved in cell wall biosynthesis